MAQTLNCKHDRVEFVIHRIREHRWIYSTCQSCGREWTVDEPVVDLADTVTADEIIEVHDQLALGRSLKDTIG